MISSLLLLTTVLVTYGSATPILIGFRTVCEHEATNINSLGSVFWDSNHPSAKWNGQLGLGKSHSDIPGLWSGLIAGNFGGDWFCYTTAEDSKIRDAAKVWINPIEEPAPNQNIYPYDEAQIQRVLRDAHCKKPERALRLGAIMGGEELLIPAMALPGPTDSTGGPLALETFCFKTQALMTARMREKGIIDTKADYNSDIFTSKNYRSMGQARKRATMDKGEGESEAAPGLAPRLRFMPRDPKGLTTRPNDPSTLQLAKGYTITLKKDPKAKKFPNPRVDACSVKPTDGKKPKVNASTRQSNSGGK